MRCPHCERLNAEVRALRTELQRSNAARDIVRKNCMLLAAENNNLRHIVGRPTRTLTDWQADWEQQEAMQ